jgi:phage shock protein A
MQTLNRAKLIVRSQVSDLLTKAENTRKMRDLIVEDMHQNIRGVKLLIAGAIADLKLIQQEICTQDMEAKRWEEKVVFALKKGENDLACRTLARKCEHIERADQYCQQIATQRETIDFLKSSLKMLETKLDTMRYRIAKLAVAESMTSPRPAFIPTSFADPVIDTSAFDAYDQMVDRVRDLEAHAEALAELTQGDDLEQKFDELENQEKIEEDLAVLKAKITTEKG